MRLLYLLCLTIGIITIHGKEAATKETLAAGKGIVVLSEIKPYREGKCPALWVELFNHSDKAVSLAGWSLLTEEGTAYVFEKDAIIKGKKTFLVAFGKPKDISPDVMKCGPVIAEDKWRKLGITECGLAGPNGALVDFVGIENAGRNELRKLRKAASRLKLWQTGDKISLGQHKTRLFGAGGGWPTGGTVARGDSRFRPHKPPPDRYNPQTYNQIPKEHRWRTCLPVWEKLPPDQSTPGARNRWLSPIPMSHHKRGLDPMGPKDIGKLGFRWRAGNCPVQLQIAKDSDFKKMVLDIQSASCRPFEETRELAVGTYYWRIRANAEGWEGMSGTSAWCETLSFTVVKKVKRQR